MSMSYVHNVDATLNPTSAWYDVANGSMWLGGVVLKFRVCAKETGDRVGFTSVFLHFGKTC